MQNITIFTDGSSRGNPGRGGWGAVVSFEKVVGRKKQKWIQEIGGRENNTTNNRMELTAVIESLDFVSKLTAKSSKLTAVINTDSSYVLKGAKEWVYGWQKNNWKTKTKQAVLNQDLWEKFLKVSTGLKIDWHLLKGHTGIPANERCDAIATSFADLSADKASDEKPRLFNGPIENYPVSLKLPASSAITKNLKPVRPDRPGGLKTKNSSRPYSYVSFVKGVAKTHKTWAECEKRVKGVSGAKFKKTVSPEDEKNLINLWSR